MNDRSIEVAKAGTYGEYALRNTTDSFKRKYSVPAEGGNLKVREEVKARINFTRLNLNDDKVNLSQEENGLAGVDRAAVSSHFAQAQLANQATLSAPARVLGLPTLLDFLK